MMKYDEAQRSSKTCQSYEKEIQERRNTLAILLPREESETDKETQEWRVIRRLHPCLFDKCSICVEFIVNIARQHFFPQCQMMI